jgi:hypothetical protein
MTATKAQARALARKKWGKDWHTIHPVMRKARLAWAFGQLDGRYWHPASRIGNIHSGHVTVKDNGDVYTI